MTDAELTSPSCGMSLQPLPKQDVVFHYMPNGTVHVGAHTLRDALFWTKVVLVDFPNDYSTLDDLEDALFDTVNVLAGVQYENLIQRYVNKTASDRPTGLRPLPLDDSV